MNSYNTFGVDIQNSIAMIDQVKKAIEQIESLSPERQLEIAKMIQDEIKWDNTFEQTHNELDKLSEEAIKEYEQGKTSDKGWK